MTGNLRKIIEDFHHTIVEEVDFLKEAQNIERFRDFLDEIGESSITAPKVYHRATTVRVLTMERLYGVPLTDLDSIKKLVDDPEERLITTMNTWFQSLLFCDFFHADVHAGNLMVLVDGRVAFIDFGIVGRTGKEFWRGLTKLINGLMTADYRMLAEALVEMNATSGDVDIETFASQLEEIFTESNWISFKLLTEGVVDEARINYILDRMIQVCRDNGLTIPREFVLLIKQVLYFDRYVRILAPNLTTVLPAGAGKAAGRSILSKIEYVP